MYESGLIGIIGSIVGVILGCLLNSFMVNNGVDMTQAIEAYGEAGGKAYIIKSLWSIQSIILSLIIPAFFCALLSIIPTTKALNKSIVDALNSNKF